MACPEPHHFEYSMLSPKTISESQVPTVIQTSWKLSFLTIGKRRRNFYLVILEGTLARTLIYAFWPIVTIHITCLCSLFKCPNWYEKLWSHPRCGWCFHPGVTLYHLNYLRFSWPSDLYISPWTFLPLTSEHSSPTSSPLCHRPVLHRSSTQLAFPPTLFTTCPSVNIILLKILNDFMASTYKRIEKKKGVVNKYQ